MQNNNLMGLTPTWSKHEGFSACWASSARPRRGQIGFCCSIYYVVKNNNKSAAWPCPCPSWKTPPGNPSYGRPPGCCRRWRHTSRPAAPRSTGVPRCPAGRRTPVCASKSCARVLRWRPHSRSLWRRRWKATREVWRHRRTEVSGKCLAKCRRILFVSLTGNKLSHSVQDPHPICN